MCRQGGEKTARVQDVPARGNLGRQQSDTGGCDGERYRPGRGLATSGRASKGGLLRYPARNGRCVEAQTTPPQNGTPLLAEFRQLGMLRVSRRRARAQTSVWSVPLTVTFDLEDNRRSASQEQRFVAMSHRFLEFVEERGITATVFVVGTIARSHPDLVRRVVGGGHELGLHGLRHVALGDVGKTRLRDELIEGRELLEDVAKTPVTGFRAPIFSLTPKTAWAVAEIVAAGFAYSSSVLPATSPLHGWPNVPREAFRWDDGLVELPCPVVGLGPVLVPFLGGIYLRYLPLTFARPLARKRADSQLLWSYSHPYDLDPDEPFFVMPHAGWLTSRILHTRRGLTLRRLEAMLAAAGGPGRPLGEIAQRLGSRDLPSVSST